jgi:N-acetylmuramoyl-L-alanine amidase
MLNQPTDFVNSLVEIAFLSNASDEKRIMKTQFQEDVAKKITLGIMDWLKSIQ